MKSKKTVHRHLTIDGVKVKPGSNAVINIEIPGLYTGTKMTMPVRVFHGKDTGPCLFVCAAIHGDEINGVEILRRLHGLKLLSKLHGTLITVPVVNVYGFNNQSRYLPDRRDLNRSFPGAATGSLASRLAYIFMREIAARATHGIDLHTAAIHRDNFPHVRACLDNRKVGDMARAFPVPVILDSKPVEGSMRKALYDSGVPVILYEAGEALRFNEFAIRTGVQGIVAVMRKLDMLPDKNVTDKVIQPVIATSSTWVRATRSGVLRNFTALGSVVKKNQSMGVITDPAGRKDKIISAPISGLVIGRSNVPLVQEGEALFHIAHLNKTTGIKKVIDMFQQSINSDADRIFSDEKPLI